MRASVCGVGAAVTLLVSTASCSSTAPIDPLKLDGNRLTVTNTTSTDWQHVEVWLNMQFRLTTPLIRAGQRVDASLDAFVEGYGRRFDFKRMQVKDLRLEATLPDGKPFELKKEFEVGGLAGTLKGLSGGAEK